jgi:hypothetical protein
LEQVAEGIPVRMAALWRTVRGDAPLAVPAKAKGNA